MLFAVDSIPAIFAIAPNDPFILYTSNIFAILGLRSLFFLLSNSMEMFSKLKYGLAIILSFIGLKMLVAPVYHIETLLSLLIVVSLLMGSIVLSILTRKKQSTEKLHSEKRILEGLLYEVGKISDICIPKSPKKHRDRNIKV